MDTVVTSCPGFQSTLLMIEENVTWSSGLIIGITKKTPKPLHSRKALKGPWQEVVSPAWKSELYSEKLECSKQRNQYPKDVLSQQQCKSDTGGSFVVTGMASIDALLDPEAGDAAGMILFHLMYLNVLSIF